MMNESYNVAESVRETPQRFAAIALSVVYYLVLMLDYEHLISPRFQYMGFYFRDIGIGQILMDLAFVIVPAFWLPIRGEKPSQLAATFIYLISYVPTILMVSVMNGQITSDLTVLKIFVMIAMCIIIGVPKLVPSFTIPTIRLSSGGYLFLLLLMCGAAFYYIGRTHGFSLRMHAITEVYSQRDEYKAALGATGMSNYLSGILRGVAGPILITVGITSRRYWLSGVGVFLCLFIFSVQGSKSAMLAPAYVAVTYVLVRYFSKRALLLSLAGTVGIVIVGSLTADVSKLYMINDLFVRRILIMQGMLFECYYEAFADSEPLMLRHSILRFLGDAPIVSPETYIGKYYFSNTNHANAAHANANILVDGFINLHLVGILISAVFSALFLTALDRASSALPAAVGVASCAMSLQMITQTGLTKVIGSHGGLVLFIFLVLMPVQFAMDKRAQREQYYEPDYDYSYDGYA